MAAGAPAELPVSPHSEQANDEWGGSGVGGGFGAGFGEKMCLKCVFCF